MPVGSGPTGRPTARPTTWGSLRGAVVWQGLRAVLGSPSGGGPGRRVVDAGGGTGGFAVPLAELGHEVVVVDPSPDSLAALERRALEQGVADRVRGVQGDLGSLLEVAGADSADLVLVHSVLEVVDDPLAGLRAAAAVAKPGGAVSVLAATRAGAVLGRALSGRFEEAQRASDSTAGRWSDHDTVLRRFDRGSLEQLLEQAGLAVEAVHGVRIFSDLVPGGLLDSDPAATDALLRLESALADTPPYVEIAAQLHVLARR